MTDATGAEDGAQVAAAAVELVRAVALGIDDAASIDDTLEFALGEVCRHLDWPLGHAWRRGRGGAELLVSSGVWHGDEAERIARLQGITDATPLRSGVGLAGRTLETRRPEWAVDAGDDGRSAAAPGVDEVGYRAVLAIPVVLEDEVVAVLEFLSEGTVTPDGLLDAAMRCVASLLARTVERVWTVQRFEEGEVRFHALVEHAFDVITVVDADGTIRYSSPSATRMLGYPYGSQAGTVVFDLVHADDRERVRSALQSLIDSGATAGPLQFRLAHADGSWRDVEATATNVADEAAIEGAVVVNIRDVSERNQAEAQLSYEHLHDPLTGLANRVLFVEQAERALALARRHNWSTGVFAVDVDGFRRINDEFGHDVGDEMLVAVAHRLETSLRQHDTIAWSDGTVARIGADEFLLLCENVPDAAVASAIAARVLDAIAAPMALGGRVLSVTASVGIALADGDTQPEPEPERPILDAEAALRQAKGLGGARHEFFSVELHDRAAAAAALSDALHHAFECGEFHLVYQPKVSLSTDRTVGVEALLRWDHPQRGLVSPAEFIPAAEASGLIVDIGAWVLNEACRQGATWQQAFPRMPPLSVAINVSARQFRSGLADTVRAAIADSGIDPAGVCLEVTETIVMDDIATAIAVLGELKELGLAVSVDDFGTGYSSLAYLRRLPLDEVKIDKTFVDGLGIDPEDTAIVAAVISLAHALDRDVVAEGVETLEQLEKLRSLGCEFAQGYFLARPMPASDLDELLTGEGAGARLPRDVSGRATAMRPDSETVLVADDAADVRQLAHMSLTAAGFTVEEAVDGATAIALARLRLPDCVVLDIRMPDMTGIEVCKALRSDPVTAACTIVMLTSRADAADKVEAFSAGADEYIVKPFAPRDLVSRVRTALRRRQGDNLP
jgi:diguanylate cyclase (GGDEF)-like protein/PAS domain S-box-containing protein